MRFTYMLAAMVGVVLLGQTVLPKIEGLTEEQASVAILDDPLGGFVVLQYKMGSSIHQIRYSSISAVVFTDAGHTTIFDGGRLRNNIDMDEYKEAFKKYLEKKDAR